MVQKLFKVVNLGAKNMQLSSGGKNLNFKQVRLYFDDKLYYNVFADKTNKSLLDTIEHRRYLKLKNLILEKYSEFLQLGIGEFLAILKNKNDLTYKLFLNKYGDLSYSNFWIEDEDVLDKKGIYAYKVKDEIKYIGRCTDNFKRRINFGYGKIHPKNCYKDGQATNCHLNSNITKNKENVTLWVYFLEDDLGIMKLENNLISIYTPDWNIAKSYIWGNNKKTNNVRGDRMVNIEKLEPTDSLTDKIRKFVWENRVEPARKRGLDKITIRAGDIHNAMDLKSRMPAVCSALKTKIDRMYNIEIIKVDEPPSGQGANVYVTYKLSK